MCRKIAGRCYGKSSDEILMKCEFGASRCNSKLNNLLRKIDKLTSNIQAARFERIVGVEAEFATPLQVNMGPLGVVQKMVNNARANKIDLLRLARRDKEHSDRPAVTWVEWEGGYDKSLEATFITAGFAE